jgi:ketosteroid isomerase-like protein
MDNRERNIEATKRMYKAVPEGDGETALSLMDPEIRIIYYGDEVTPYAGEYHGIDGAVQFLTRVGENLEIPKIEAYTFIADGDDLAVWGHLWFVSRKTGRAFDSDFAHIITLRDGKWLFFRDFFNSAVASEVFRSEQ